MYIGINDYNDVYWKHLLQATMHNSIFGTFTRIRKQIAYFHFFHTAFHFNVYSRRTSASNQLKPHTPPQHQLNMTTLVLLGTCLENGPPS